MRSARAAHIFHRRRRPTNARRRRRNCGSQPTSRALRVESDAKMEPIGTLKER